MLSRREANRLSKLLERAEQLCREYAASQSYRRDAMHAIGERLMEAYHDRQVNEAGEVVERIRAARADLGARIERVDAQPLRRIAGASRA